MVPGPGAWRIQSGEKPRVLLGALEEAGEKGPYRGRLAGAVWGPSLPAEGEGPAALPAGLPVSAVSSPPRLAQQDLSGIFWE